MSTNDDIEAGRTITRTRTFTREEVEQFAELSGDTGYHHLVAGQSGSVMVHGLLTATLPTAIGGEIDYVVREMTLEFPQPVYTGEEITCEVTVDAVSEADDRTRLAVSWTCTNPDDEVVLTGSSSGVIFG